MIKKSKMLIISLILFAFGNVFASENNSQIWTDVSATFKLSDYWNTTISEEMRYIDDDLSYYHTDVGFSTKSFIDGTKVGLNYRLYRYRSDGGPWSRVQSPHINFTIYDDIFKLPISNRFRFQFIDNEEKEDLWVFRNKTTVKLDNIFTISKFKPYISDEFFISLKGDAQIRRNRLSVGFTHKLSNNVDTKIFYLLQTSKSSKNRWSDTDVFGFSLKFKF